MQDYVGKATSKIKDKINQKLVANCGLNHQIQMKMQITKAPSQNGHSQTGLVSLKNSMNPVELWTKDWQKSKSQMRRKSLIKVHRERERSAGPSLSVTHRSKALALNAFLD